MPVNLEGILDMEDPVNNGKRAVQPAEDAALDRIADLEQAGLLEKYLTRSRLDPRRRRRFRTVMEDIRRRQAAWQHPDDRVTLPIVLWDGQEGWPVVAWLTVGWNAIPALSPGWTGLTDPTKSALTLAGIHAASWLRTHTGVDVQFLPHRISLSVLAAAGGPLPSDLVLDGPSFTGAFAVALLSLWTERALPPDLWIFVQFSQPGNLMPVGRLTEKLGAVLRERLPCRKAIAVVHPTGRRPALPGERAVTLTPGAPFQRLVSAVWPGEESRFALAPLFRAEASVEAMLDPLENGMQLQALVELADWMDQSKVSDRLRFRARRALGAVASRLGNIATARAAMEAALEIGRGCLDNERIDLWDYTELCNNLGVLFTDLHEWARARKWLNAGLSRLEGARGHTVREQGARLRSSLGQMELWRGRPERAEPLLRQALAMLGTGRNLNYLAGALVCRHRAANRKGQAPPPGWLEEAADLLAQSRRWPRFQSETEYLFHRAFLCYWEARLAHERGVQAPGLQDEIESLLIRMPAAVFPLAGAACWLTAAGAGRQGFGRGETKALELLGVLARQDGVILRLLALGWAARLWEAGIDGPAIIQALSREASEKTAECKAVQGATGKRLPEGGMSNARLDREMIRCVLAVLDMLEPLTGAFAAETTWCRQSMNTAGKSWSLTRRSSRLGELGIFLSALAEKIAY